MKSLLTSCFAVALFALAPGCKGGDKPGGAESRPGASDASAGATLGAPAAGGGARADGDTITVKGSDTMVILVQRWAEDFMKKNPGKRVQVTGGGSGVGLAALLNGTTDVAMASRHIKDAEKQQVQSRYKVQAVETSVAKDGVTFYVNEANPVKSLTVEQLKAIYVGDTPSWKAVGGPDAPIVVYSRENSSGTYSFVKDEVLGGDDFAPGTLTLPGTAAVVNAVAKEKNGIGYGGAAYAKGVKELAVKGKTGEAVMPTEQNVESGTYPLSRDLFFYTRGEPRGLARQFIDYALSPEGQAIVKAAGYFPVKAK